MILCAVYQVFYGLLHNYVVLSYKSPCELKAFLYNKHIPCYLSSISKENQISNFSNLAVLIYFTRWCGLRIISIHYLLSFFISCCCSFAHHYIPFFMSCYCAISYHFTLSKFLSKINLKKLIDIRNV